jgi:hypothetical protein
VPPQILPWLSFSVPGVKHLAVLTACTLVSLYCFFACALLTSYVPPNWVPELEPVSAVQEVKKKVGQWEQAAQQRRRRGGGGGSTQEGCIAPWGAHASASAPMPMQQCSRRLSQPGSMP